MEIDNDMRVTLPGVSDSPVRPNRSGESFSQMLDADRLRAQSEATRNSAIASQKIVQKNDNTEDIDFIRENGITAYAEEVHERKKEEMRQKVLASMGLTDEMLSEMSDGQRQSIEESIAREIQERLAAESMTNGGSESEDDGEIGQPAVADINAGNLLAAQVLMNDSGAMIGLLAIEEEAEAALSGDQKSKDTTG